MSTKPYRVLVADDSVEPEGIAMLEQVASVTTLPLWPPESDLIRAAKGVDAIMSRSAIISEVVIAASPRLKIVSRHGVGVDYVDIDACTRHEVLVTITGDANSQAVSEQAFGLLFAVARKIAFSDADIKAGRWRRHLMTGLELHRKVLGIVGLGRIGSRVAKHATGFEMEVLACDPYVPAAKAESVGATLVDLDTLLQRSDFITLHVPLTEETRHLIGAAELAMVKPSAILINTARGPVVDEGALYDALIAKKLAGAGLDVFAQEPLLEGYALVGLENVVCSPHCAGQTAEAMVRVSTRAAENILCVLRGEVPALDMIVNPEVLGSAPWASMGGGQ